MCKGQAVIDADRELSQYIDQSAKRSKPQQRNDRVKNTKRAVWYTNKRAVWFTSAQTG